MTTVPVKAASKFWNGGTHISDAREPEWRGGQPDTSNAVSCEQCGRRWLNIEWLAQHVALAHAPRLPPRSGATGTAREAITDRIADGTFKPGAPIRQGDLAQEIGVSAGVMSAAVGQLAAEGVLGYQGTGFQRRAHIVAAH